MKTICSSLHSAVNRSEDSTGTGFRDPAARRMFPWFAQRGFLRGPLLPMRAEERNAATNNGCASIAAGAEVMRRWPGGFLGPR